MTQTAATDESFKGLPAFDDLIRGNQAWLAERGTTIIGSGCFRSGQLSGSVHTDFGPEDQDKDANQDYAVVWLPHGAEVRKRFRVVLAMADGLTASYRSEWASAVACSVALRAVAEGGSGKEPKDLARYAFNEAGRSLGQLADNLIRQPEASCPPGQFLSTWKYILRKGALFQSTLTLAWLDSDYLRIAMVGDGGALWRGQHALSQGQRAADRVLAECDLNTHQVHALGPADQNVQEFDCWQEEELKGPFLCALHTDGVGRGLGGNGSALLDELERLHAAGVENAARSFIEQAVDEHPQDFDDNLTLAVIRAD